MKVTSEPLAVALRILTPPTSPRIMRRRSRRVIEPGRPARRLLLTFHVPAATGSVFPRMSVTEAVQYIHPVIESVSIAVRLFETIPLADVPTTVMLLEAVT